MGRKKIQISRITDERNRQVTFNKRKFGVMKKAYELSVLCDCEIALIIFSSSNKLYQYASTDMDKVLLKYTEYNEPHESLTNKNIIEALNKKEHKNGTCSPESPEPEGEYQLTPRTEAKYNKIDEEFQLMMQRNQLNGTRVAMGQASYSLPVSVPVSSSYDSPGLMQPSPQMPHTSVSPRPSSSGTDTGGLLDMSNGYPSSTSPLNGPPSPGPVQGLSLKVSSKQHSPAGRSNLRVVIPGGQGPGLSPEDVSRTSVSLNAPVVSLQTPSLPGMAYPSSLPGAFGGPQDFSVNADLSLTNLQALHHGWNTGPLTAISHTSGLPHLAVSSSTPPPASSSPLPLKIKSEPISPPRDHSIAHLPRPASTGHITPTSGPMTPSGHPSPGDPHPEYDSGPLSKRTRLTEGWAS